MKGTVLKDPICSFFSLCLWSLSVFEVKEASIQRKAPQGAGSDEHQVLCAPGGIFGMGETKLREEDALEMWSR